MVGTGVAALSRARSWSIFQRAPGTHFFWLWLLVASIAVLVSSLVWPSAHIGNELSKAGLEQEYLPVGIDSFYHARRILDTVANPGAFYQFDAKIHAPEGSLLAWPWGYDYAMAWLVRGAKLIGIPGSPIAILIWIPVVAVLASVALTMLIARRLSLSLWSTTIAGLCVALSPLTQVLHGVGNVDHHFAEYIALLAALLLGLRWFSKPDDSRAALSLAVVLGIAPAFHNALFILQVPALAVMTALWVQGIRFPKRQVAYFAIGLTLTTLMILLPSLPFRLGRFDFYTLSWFHLYVASGTSIAVVLFAALSRTPRNVSLLVLVAVALLLPLVAQIVLAQSFLAGSITRLDAIAEMLSPLRMSRLVGPSQVSRLYSWLIWLLPVSAAYSLVQAWRTRASGELLFWTHAILGLALVLMQVRLHYFGSFALYLPLLVFVERTLVRRPDLRRPLMLATTLLFIVCYAPPLRYNLTSYVEPAGDRNFIALRPVLASLREACEREPGIVLSDNDAGHYIRYYTECSVIANNFLLTRQHTDKIEQIDYLTSLSAQSLPKVAPYVRYILLRPVSISRNRAGNTVYMTYSPKNAQLFEDLMLKPAEEVPAGYTLLRQANTRRKDQAKGLVYARLYVVDPAFESAQ